MLTYDKPALDVDAQLAKLAGKGLVIEDGGFCRHCLSEVSYYRLKAYWYPFLSRKEPGRFVAGTGFAKIWSYYRFDRQLKFLVMDGLERVEVALRAQLINHFCLTYGPFGYRSEANLAQPINRMRYQQTLGFVDGETAKSKEEFVQHFRGKYDTTQGLPFWMASEVMTFGNLLTFFRLLKMRDKKAIAREFGVAAPILESWLTSLNYIRNVCAHHGRLWNRELAVCPDLPDKDPMWHEADFPIKPSRIYAVLCILRCLVGIVAPQSGWPKRLVALLQNHPEIHRLSMGIPEHFEQSLVWADNLKLPH